MWLVRSALQNSHLYIVIALMTVVAGVLAVAAIPVDILPTFRSPGVMVMTYYSGMPPNVIERNITNRIERWCGQATGVQKVESKSLVGISIVRLYFRDDIDPAAALTEVSSLALSTLPTLPPGTLPPIVRPFDPTATLPLAILSVSQASLFDSETEGNSLSDEQQNRQEIQLQDYAKIDLRNQLGGLPGVVAPTVFGGRERTIMVYPEPKKMQGHKISLLEMVKSLRSYNAMLTAGTAKFGNKEVMFDTNAMVRSVEDFHNIPLKTAGDGGQILLGDVAKVKDTSSIQTSKVRIDSKPQVYVPIYRQLGASSLSVVDSVNQEIPLMKQRAPEGMDLDLVMDQSVYVRQAIKSLVEEGILGAILAAAMVFLFLGCWRSTVIATVSIPLAIFAAIASLLATGNTINAMTLGGLALAVGPLIDNAIVVLENVHRHLGMGKSPAKAAEDGASEVATPALVATLSTIIVLVPLVFMPGMGKFLFRPLAMAVGFAMITSLFFALTFVTGRCATWLKSHPVDVGQHHPPTGVVGRFLHGFDRLLGRFTERYQVVLDWSLNHRAWVLVLVSGLFGASLLLFPLIGREFFPQVDSGQVTMYVRCPTGTKLERTNEIIGDLEDFIRQQIPKAELKMIVSELGLTTNWSAAYTSNSGPQDAAVKIQLTPDRTKSSQEYAVKLRHALVDWRASSKAFADVEVAFDTGGIISAALNYGASSPLELQITGGTQAEAYAKATEVRDLVREIRGAADVRIQQRLDYPFRMLEVDRIKAQMHGLDLRDIFQTLTTALNSSIQVDRNFWIDPVSGNQYFIVVQYPEETDRDLTDVLRIPVQIPKTGELVTLGTFLKRPDAEQKGPAEVVHDNLARVFSVMVNTEGRDIGSLATTIQQELKSVTLPKGMVLRMSGEFQRMNESFSNLGGGLAIASILVYLLMVALFRSYLTPLIIMFAVPLGIIGVLIMLYVTDTSLNVQSFMGVIFMVGIVVANSTMLIDFANKQHASGMTVRHAIRSAATIRLRPILMTFLATFLDLLPMAIGFGKGSEANVPLARAVIGGLLASTFLTLLVVPILYTLFIRETQIPANLESLAGEGHHD